MCNKGNPAHKVEKRGPWKSQKAHGLAKDLTRQGEEGNSRRNKMQRRAQC